jgi:hypothetical protein
VPSELAATLRHRGHRVTPQRLVIHDALRALDRHATAEEVLAAVSERLPNVSAPTVYATLELFEDLGLVRHLRAGDPSRIIERAHRKETFEDWPWIILYRELDAANPGSRFDLTKRDPERWVRSYRNMLGRQGSASEKLNGIRRVLYGLPFPQVTEEQLVARYEAHNRDVEEYFGGRAGDLLVVDWELGDGWEKLCAFLDRPVPAAPFPHANPGRYSQRAALKRVATRLARKLVR